MHDLGHALRAADDVDLLQEGRLIAVGACAEVLTAPAVARTIGVAVEIGETPQGAPYIIPIQRTRP
jgi:ABC-type cobalamin transport system ATPase subunit